MMIRMNDAEQPTTEIKTSRQVMTTANPVIDFGATPLVLSVQAPEAGEVIDFVDPDMAARASIRGGFFVRIVMPIFRMIIWLARSLFGISSLILFLAVIAAIPIVNFLALGYLLEVEGRMARSGRFRDAFPLLELAPRLGSIVLGIWLWVAPLRLLSSAAADARIIDPRSFADVGLHCLVAGLAVFVAIHLCLALARGGSLWSFLWPLTVPFAVLLAPIAVPVVLCFMLISGRRLHWLLTPVWNLAAELRRLPTRGYWNQASAAVEGFIGGLRLRHHFLLGLKGYVGAMIWLVIPTALFAAASKTEGGPLLLTVSGGALLILVLSWVPFLQAHYAAENRFGAMFELYRVCQIYKNAPFAWLITMLMTLTLALPMYLFKIALPPADAMWMVTIVFIVTIYPVKVITGWAYHRALVGEQRRAFFVGRWLKLLLVTPILGIELEAKSVEVLLTRLVLFPLLAVYVFLLFFTQFIGEHGKGVLFEHHAFLLPAPF